MKKKPGTFLRAPLIADCCANLECRAVDTRMVEGYCLFVLEVVKAGNDPARKWARALHHARGTQSRGRNYFWRVCLPSIMSASGSEPAPISYL